MTYYSQNGQFLPGRVDTSDAGIIYTVNRDQYRAPEFSTVNWSESIVIFGCSHVQGQGLQDNQTISYQLEKLSGIPVINLGNVGSSMTVSLYNQMVLRELGETPRAVVNIWTSITRLTYFRPDTHMPVYRLSNGIAAHLFTMWNADESNPRAHSLMAQRLSRLLWAGVPSYEATFFADTADALNIPLIETLDKAVDRAHPGPKTAQAAAKLILDNLENQL